jgi:uncharacterized protein
MMFVGVLTIRLFLHGVRSLKEKRSIVLRVKDRTRAKFNCAVSEVDDLDKWQAATLGFSVVSNESAHADASLNHIAKFVDSLGLAEVVGQATEIMSFKEP